jgi:glycosyl hydrolase family 64 (putative beta-1,3-glucanase)/Big-like domain-containing protein
MNIRKRLPLFGTWGMLAALTLSACGGGHNGGAGNTSSTAPVVPPALVSIAVTPATATVATGATQQFTATGTYSDKSTKILTTSVMWSSSNTAIATISTASGSQGLATAVGIGSASIVATDGTIMSPGVPLAVTAVAPTLVSIAVTPAAASVASGATQQFAATGTYSDHSTKALTTAVSWSSSNAAVASISNTSGAQGLATGVSAGSASIVATAGSVMSPGATLTVTAVTTPPTGVPTIKTQPAGQTVIVGQHALFNVIATGASTYQWFENGTAIGGATSATYYTPALQTTDAGASFTVVVSNSLGHVTSSAATVSINPAADGGPPATFWGNTAALPVATQSMTFSFVNQTDGVYPDSQVFWSVQGHTPGGTQVNEVHSIADQPTYDMPPLTSARMYFYIAPNASGINNGSTSYYDFIEFNIGGLAGNYNFNGDTTRVDAFGLKTAVRLVCRDGTDLARGEDYGTFLEDRSITFLKYLAEVPAVFASTATQNAPYRIVNPGAADFGPGGVNAGYYQSYLDLVWANNNIDKTIVPEPTPFLNLANGNLNDLSAALNRHVADKPGTFTASGKLVNPSFWSTMPSSTFYQAGPANYYAEYWHTHGIGGFAYGFPYDDVGGHSSDIGCGKPAYLVVAIGW